MNDPGLFEGLICFAVFLVLGCFFLVQNRDQRFDPHVQLRLFAAAFILRYGLSIVIYELGLVNVIKDEDAAGWAHGVILNIRWQEDSVGLFDLPSELMKSFSIHQGLNLGYRYILALYFYLTGTSTRLAATALNAFCGALTVVFVYRVAALLFSRWVAVSAGWILCFFPSLLMWSAQSLKEPIVILIEVVVIYGCVQVRSTGFSLKYLTIGVIGILCLFPLRFYAAYAAGIAAVLSLIIPQPRSGGASFGTATIVIALLLLMIGGAGVQMQLGILETFDARRLEKIRYGISHGIGAGSAVVLEYDTSTLSGVTMTLLVGGIHVLLAPFPWHWGGASLRLLMTAPEIVGWWVIFAAGVLPGLWYVIRNRLSDCLPFLLFVSGLMVPYSYLFANIGLAYRQRAQLLPWLIIIAMAGFEYYWLKRRDAETTASHQPLKTSSPWRQPYIHSRVN